MKHGALDFAIAEAQRFLARANALKAAHTQAMADAKAAGDNPLYASSPIDGSRESAAVRRASMDLTRALAELRR